MLLLLLQIILGELNETGYLYSVGKKKFLSLDGEDVRLVPKYVMPSMFEIETRTDGSSYTLRIYPHPRKGDNVVDKDWFWNGHKLSIRSERNWQSEYFIFSLVPKNMLKIVVKEKCAEVTDDGLVKAKDCLSRKDAPNQYFRWFNKNDQFIVEQFVERHGGKHNKKNNKDREYDSEEFNKPRKKQIYDNYGGNPNNKREDDDSSDFFKRPRGRYRGRGRDYNRRGGDDDDDSFDSFYNKYPHDRNPHNKYPTNYPPNDRYPYNNYPSNERYPYNNYPSNDRYSYNKDPINYTPNDRYPHDEGSGSKNIIYKYNERKGPYQHILDDDSYDPSIRNKKFGDGLLYSKRNENNDDDICSDIICDSYNKRGKNIYGNNQGRDIFDNTQTRDKNSKGSLDCDELVDGIENLICDIERMPNFIV